MKPEDYKHVLVVRKDVWYLRAYCWMWAAKPEKANICKLFWGYVFAPLNLLARLVWVLIWPLRRLLRNVDWEPPPPQRKPKEEIPSRISEFFARPLPRRISKSVAVVFGLLVVAVLVWSLVLLVPALPTVAGAVRDWLLTTKGLHLTAAVFAVWAIGIGGLVWLDERFHFDKRLEERKERKHAVGELTFGEMLLYGARAVKANTCPRLEVSNPKHRDRGTA